MKKTISLNLPIVLIAITIIFSSCSLYRVDSKDITTTYYPSKKSISDVIYLESIDKPHEIIGIVTVNAERRQGIDDIMDKIKREAAILGGDIITDIKTDATGYWKSLPAQNFIGNGYIRANFSAVVAVFK
ncbi:MAG: hypothetical protein KKD07_01660 [Candidatus Omnitrophica bacterium]|nr:hypothetical protein [Candidatus Omnitrophota bacterium]MBU1997222.1 hypothetical protein [Candidatus Omnitrophota bacterium]MBU4333128.1 hypothetical protein [Candidatus Omnitrophota bacterium]